MFDLPDWNRLITRAEHLFDRLETLLPPVPAAPDWSAPAFRWQPAGQIHRAPQLIPITRLNPIRLGDLTGIDDQKNKVIANTCRFLAGHPANNVLLTGARGTGKSSLIKALLNEFSTRGLRLIETDKADLVDLPAIIALIQDRPERFIIFCDDLSFDAGETGYKTLKVALDGSLSATPDNLLIYATSNRRHLLPEFMSENLETRHVGEEVHPGEATEEKISLSERFGLWLSFYPFDQDEYLAAAAQWLKAGGCTDSEIAALEREALNWALGRGSRSGRVANQFARHWLGLKQSGNPGDGHDQGH